MFIVILFLRVFIAINSTACMGLLIYIDIAKKKNKINLPAPSKRRDTVASDRGGVGVIMMRGKLYDFCLILIECNKCTQMVIFH